MGVGRSRTQALDNVWKIIRWHTTRCRSARVIKDLIFEVMFRRDVLGTQIRKSHAGHTYCTLEMRRPRRIVVVTYAPYACVADCAGAWEDTAGCAQPSCLHENLLNC